MDRKRIEWLFLIIFTLIDLYLGIEIWRSPVGLSNKQMVTGGANASIRLEMHDDGIDLPANLSDKQQTGYYLASKNHDYLSSKSSELTGVTVHYSKSENSIVGTPKETVFLNSSHKIAMEQLADFKNNPKNVPFGKQFKYEPSMSGDNEYTYVQSSGYGQVYDPDAQLTITVKNNQIVNYTISYMGKVTSVREPQLIISAWHAVRAMYIDQEISNNSKVIQVKLGYSKLVEVRGSTILLPTWLIWVENKTTKNTVLKRVNAFTAQILQTSSSYNVEKN